MTLRAGLAIVLWACACSRGAAQPAGTPPPVAGPSNPGPSLAGAELQRLFQLIDAVPSYQAPPDPLPLIQAVNALQRLGRDRAVTVLRDYLRATPRDHASRNGTFLIVRTLFEVPDPPGYLPAMRVGAPRPAAPADPRALPRFPIVIVDDIPLRVVGGYAIGGKPEAAEDHLESIARDGVLRAHPLRPPDDPLAVIDRLAGQAGTGFLRDAGLDDDPGRARILDQGLGLLGELSQIAARAPGTRFESGADVDARWQTTRRAALTGPIVWDATTDRYRAR